MADTNTPPSGRILTLSAEQRVHFLKEAKAIEDAAGTWRIVHVMAVLDCARSSIYRSPWLMSRRLTNGHGGRVKFYPGDIRLFQQLQQQGARRVG